MQEDEQRLDAELWRNDGWVFAQPAGKPTDPRADYGEWKDLHMHVPDELRQRIASQLGGLLWKSSEDDDGDGPGGVPVPA
ncbi:MAG: hypothetical protein ACRDQU_22930 [Pseudonocardiaceae bacterium]